MIYIKSKDNEKYKGAKSLLKPKYRNKVGKYLAEGLRTIELALEYDAEIEAIFISESFFLDESKRFIIEKLDKCTKVYKISDEMFKNIASTENSQGITAIIKMKEISMSDLDINRHKKFIVLDRIQDPGNLGTIIRTADAAGFDMIIMTKGCVDLYNPKVVRSAMGSMFYMDIVMDTQERVLEVLKSNGVQIVSSYLRTDNMFNRVKYDEMCALLVGNEANGICDFWIENSDLLVKIPMLGKAESLNVGISAALLMYEINFA